MFYHFIVLLKRLEIESRTTWNCVFICKYHVQQHKRERLSTKRQRKRKIDRKRQREKGRRERGIARKNENFKLHHVQFNGFQYRLSHVTLVLMHVEQGRYNFVLLLSFAFFQIISTVAIGGP